MPAPLSEQQVAQIQHLRYNEGLTVPQIMERVGVSRDSVIRYTPQKKPKAHSPELIAEIRRLRDEGRSVSEVMELTGVSRRSVIKHSRVEGGGKRSTHWKQKRHEIPSSHDRYAFPVDLPDVEKDHFGWTPHELAEAVRHARDVLFPHTNEGLNR